MTDVDNTVTTMASNLKEIYGDGPIPLVPKFAWCRENIEFSQKDLVGGYYHNSVLLSSENGVTYSKPRNGAFAINDSVAAEMGDAKVEPSQILIKATVDYESAYRATKGGKQAFVDTVGLVVQNMVESANKRLEIEFLYGQTGIGAVNANTSGSADLVISAATWSPGIWSGLKGAYVSVIDANFDAAEDTSEKIAGIAPSTRTITLTNTQTLDAGDLLFFLGQVEAAGGGAEVHHSMVGLDKMTTTTSGTLFNINVGTYADTWQAAPEQTSTAQLTMAKIMAGVSEVVNRGCMEDLVCLLSPRAFEVLNSDMAALRRLDGSYRYSKVESGAEKLAFFGQNGKLEIVPHLFVKWGDAFIFPPKRMKRIGSTELSFKRPGMGGDEPMVREATSNAGFEIRAYTAQAIFPERLNWLVKLSGITYA